VRVSSTITISPWGANSAFGDEPGEASAIGFQISETLIAKKIETTEIPYSQTQIKAVRHPIHFVCTGSPV
jgi:hypothetical protein